MYNVEMTESLLIIEWEEFPGLIDLISLITDFNRLSIVIIDFRISADFQP